MFCSVTKLKRVVCATQTALNPSVNMEASWCEICSDVEAPNDVSDRGQTVTAFGPDTLATLYCKNCCQSLCRRCGRRHTRQRFAADHEVVELGQVFHHMGAARGHGCLQSTCTEHSKPLVVYCRDCDKVGCLSCLSLEAHQRHRWYDVNKASQEVRQSLSHHLEQVNAKLEQCRQAADKQRHTADALKRSLHDAGDQLRAEVEKLRQDLDRCVEELESKLKAAEGKKTQMDNSCGELQERTKRLSTFVARCQQAIESASATEILRWNTELIAESKKLLELETDNDLCPSLRVVFTPTCLRQYLPQIDINLVGVVSVDDADMQSVELEKDKRFHGSVSQYQEKNSVLLDDPSRQKIPKYSRMHELQSSLLNLMGNVQLQTKEKRQPFERQSSKLLPEKEKSSAGSRWVSQTYRSFSREVVGIASIASDLYVVLKGETCIRVLESPTFQLLRSICVPDMRLPTRDLTAGVRTLYVIDDDDNLHAHHVDTGTWTKWEVSDRAWSISTSQLGDVLVTSRSSRLLLEYAPGGYLQRKIKLPADVMNPNHSVRVRADLLVLCHGDMTDQTQRVCTVDNNGYVLSCYKVDGSPWPTHLTVADDHQVYVAFKNIDQVLSFDLYTLKIDRVVASRNDGLRAPNRLHFGDKLLYVAGDKMIRSFRSH